MSVRVHPKSTPSHHHSDLSRSPLDCLHYTTYSVVCQEVFENFFRLRATATTVGLTFSNPRPRVLPLLTLTIITDSTQITIGKIHKIGKFYAPMFVRFVN